MADLTPTFRIFSDGKSWQDKVVEGDGIWSDVRAMLAAHNVTLPKTSRRPDVRLIVENISGAEITFKNPGDHSGSKEESIPASGDKRAVMIMLKGATLTEQKINAQHLFRKYDLGQKGLSAQFITDLKNGELSQFIDEAYGPAPFQAQADKLVPLAWQTSEGVLMQVKPEKAACAAYGARAATEETVFLASFQIYVKGSTTVPELAEGGGMAIAVDEKQGTTRPIVPSVARSYYGAAFFSMPVVTVHPDGMVKEVDLKNGTVIGRAANPKPPQAPPPIP